MNEAQIDVSPSNPNYINLGSPSYYDQNENEIYDKHGSYMPNIPGKMFYLFL